MREGSLEAPTRHKIDWQNPDFYDMDKINAEMHRVFDICHGCRRCFNLCDSFPRLFDLVDASPDEVAGVKTEDYKQVVDACTLCDLCFMTKCPYVPPHEWALDFPHLMLRYRAAELKHGKNDKVYAQLTETDRNGKAAGIVARTAPASPGWRFTRERICWWGFPCCFFGEGGGSIRRSGERRWIFRVPLCWGLCCSTSST